MNKRTVAIALALAACEAQQEANSERLRPVVWLAPSGDTLRVAEIWHDLEKDENCQPGTASDGQLRCLPTQRVASLNGYFGDEACEETSLVRSLGCDPKYAKTDQRKDGACDSRVAIYEVEEEWNGAVFLQVGNECRPIDRKGRRFFTLKSGDISEEFARVEQVIQ